MMKQSIVNFQAISSTTIGPSNWSHVVTMIGKMESLFINGKSVPVVVHPIHQVKAFVDVDKLNFWQLVNIKPKRLMLQIILMDSWMNYRFSNEY